MANKIGVIVKGIIVNENKVLLVKRSNKDEINPGAWEFVGGRLEFGEDLEEALKREAMEEVAINIKIDRILYATSFKRQASRHAVIIVYKCFAKDSKVMLSEEHSEYKWASNEKLRKLLDKDILKDVDKYNILPLIYEGGLDI